MVTVSTVLSSMSVLVKTDVTNYSTIYLWSSFVVPSGMAFFIASRSPISPIRKLFGPEVSAPV